MAHERMWVRTPNHGLEEVRYINLPRGWRVVLPNVAGKSAAVVDEERVTKLSLDMDRVWDFAEMMRAFDRSAVKV